MSVRIAAAVRTPFCAVGGALGGWHPVDLAAEMLGHAAERAGVDAGAIDEVWAGCAEPVGAQGANLARAAVLAAGWPSRIGGVVVERDATSGSAAFHAATAAIEAGAAANVVVLGVGVASAVPPGANALARTYGRPWGDGPAARAGDDGLLPAPSAADRAARRADIDRHAQDQWATGSHERRSMLVAPEIVPIGALPGDQVAIQKGKPVKADDIRSRPDDVATMPAAFDPDGAVTGFTFSPPADGITALLLTARPGPGLQVLGTGRAAGEPNDPLGGLPLAAAAAARHAQISLSDIDIWHLTEPTAAAVLLAIDRLDLDPDAVNPAGGTLGVGDAGAADELRLVAETGRTTGIHAVAAFGPGGAAVSILRAP